MSVLGKAVLKRKEADDGFGNKRENGVEVGERLDRRII
jgi:hypothetical protein